MNNEFEGVDPQVIDWLERQEFTALLAEQKKEVLRFFTEEEYGSMREALLMLKDPGNDRMRHHRESLMARFDERHASGKIRSLFPLKPGLWKGAAIFLLGLATAFTTGLLDLDPVMETERVLADTVYISRNVPVYETITVPQLSLHNEKTLRKRTGQVVASASYNSNRSEDREQMNVVSPRSLGNAENSVKHTSMSDDSLLKRFAFVTL
jgi:hypothetical protein